MDDNKGIPVRLTVDGQSIDIDADPEMPLLWALRDLAGKTGPKFGCGIAACGACTVHVDGSPVRSCILKVGEVHGPVTTIEGIGSAEKLHPVQQAWLEEQIQEGRQAPHESLGDIWRELIPERAPGSASSRRDPTGHASG